MAILHRQGEPIDCPDNSCLAKGRLVTQANVDTIENLWSRPTN